MPSFKLPKTEQEFRILELQGTIQGDLGGIVADNKLSVGAQVMQGEETKCTPLLLISTSDDGPMEIETHGVIRNKTVFSHRPQPKPQSVPSLSKVCPNK